MLKSRNLDDQRFDEIMEYAISRLPWLCPGWTDYNAHDPGITILELIAWYKEMQQYHMNVVTDALRKKLLKLLGVTPALAKPAACLIALPAEGQRSYPALTRLDSQADIAFELLEPAHGGGQVMAVYVEGGQGPVDMTALLAQKGISIWPFQGETGEDTCLLLGLSGQERELRLWFEIDDKRPVPRNPFQNMRHMPRVIEWTCLGSAGPLEVEDETHALSHSGFITFKFPEDFQPGDGGKGLPAWRYLQARQLDGGCEEQVHLCQVSAGLFRAAQQETWAHSAWHTLAAGENSLLLEDGVSREGGVYIFLREEDGLRFVESRQQLTEGGLAVFLDGEEPIQDGAPNLLAVSQDGLRCETLIFPTTGLPNMTIDLSLGGRKVLPHTIALVCDTLCQDGKIRPAYWHYVDDLSTCGPRDRAFTYDPIGEQLLFGDGAHGAVPPRSQQGALVASLVLSFCDGGNVPEDCGLAFGDGTPVRNTAASGGRDADCLEAASASFLRSLEDTHKCVSEADYERAALGTPGLRVAHAKAIAGFDPDEPTGHSRIPVVTVVVLPWNRQQQPLPDERFLAAVQRNLEKCRPICTVVKVAAPVYVPIGVSLQIRGQGDGLEQEVRRAVDAYLTLGPRRAIGEAVVKDDLMEALMELDGVLQIQRLELRPLGPDCYVAPRGDLRVRRNAVAYLRTLDVQIR